MRICHVIVHVFSQCSDNTVLLTFQRIMSPALSNILMSYFPTRISFVDSFWLLFSLWSGFYDFKASLYPFKSFYSFSITYQNGYCEQIIFALTKARTYYNILISCPKLKIFGEYLVGIYKYDIICSGIFSSMCCYIVCKCGKIKIRIYLLKEEQRPPFTMITFKANRQYAISIVLDIS